MNKRQEEILILIYRFRFLTRAQIQSLIQQKYHSRLVTWLNDLTKNNYLKRFYNPNTVSYPAVYSLDNQGRKYLKDNSQSLKINLKALDKIWRESKLTIQFRYHCLTLADGYISLFETTKKMGSELHFYTKNDLQNIKYLIIPHPDAYFCIKEPNGIKKYYFLDVFDYYANNQKFIKRIQKYLDYFDDGYWQDQTDCPFPEVIFVVSDERSYSYLNWYLPKILEDSDDINFYLISKEKIKKEGFNKNSLRKMEAKD